MKEKEMGKVKNIIYHILDTKQNTKMERGMDMEKKIKMNIHLKENSKMENIGMENIKKKIMIILLNGILMRKDIIQY